MDGESWTAPSVCFSGRTYPQLAQIVRASCAVAGRCWLSQVAAVAVTVAVTRDASAPSRLPPPAVGVMRRVPNGYNGLSFPNCYEVRTDDDGHLIRAAYV
jgi:hypothetical protein